MTRMRLPTAPRSAICSLLSLLLGFEAATLRRWKLLRSKWIDHGIVVADDIETAERRFFDRWFSRGASAGRRSVLSPRSIRITRSRHITIHGIIGSFPEPGARGERRYRRLRLRQSAFRGQGVRARRAGFELRRRDRCHA